MEQSLSDFGDLNFDELNYIDFDTEEHVKYLDVDAICLQTTSKKRFLFDINNQVKQIEKLIDRLPNENETFYFLSGKFGFSSIAVIEYIARKEKIKNLYVSTFRLGAKQAKIICDLAEKKQIENAFFITGKINNMETSRYDYFTQIKKEFDKYGFGIVPTNNHSKVLLFETERNHYVCETSSNLNENPQLEQFALNNDVKLYNHYLGVFEFFKKYNGSSLEE